MGQPGLEQQDAVVLADLQRAGLPCPRDLVSVLAISGWRGTLQWNRVEVLCQVLLCEGVRFC